jgi:microcystin-dependent protein
MSDPFLGEIRMFGGNFAPRGWALCNGQTIAITQNNALFAILGTTYGGDGVTNFKLPNLQGRLPMHWGNGAGLTPRTLGELAGGENAALSISNLPAHTHVATFTPSGTGVAVNVTTTVGTLPSPVGNMLGQSPAAGPTAANIYAPSTSPASGTLAGVSGGGGGSVAVAMTGSSIPVGVISPFLTFSFIIALSGIFPSRN